MLNNFLNKLTFRRNFWQTASFSQIGELYISRLMRSVAVNLGSAFMSVYMLKNGYSITAVAVFWASYFGIKMILTMPLAQMIAMIGAKKAIIISNLLYVPAMISFMFLVEAGWWAIGIAVVFQAISTSLYDVSYMISFSRLKSSSSAGKQVAIMDIVEKAARGLSPLLGGLLAMFVDPRAAIGASILFFVIAAWPMTRSADTMTTGFRLAPKNFPWKLASRSLLVELPIGFDIFASGSAWSIFLASVIFTAGGDRVYAELGLLTTLILLVSIVSAHAYGKLIDRKAGGQLLFWTALANVFIHLFRAFVRTPVAAIGSNAANEVATTGYSMAVTRGLLDVADNSGYRVFYVGMLYTAIYTGATIGALSFAAIIYTASHPQVGFTIFYLLTAAVVSFIMLAKYRIYKPA